MQYLPLGCSGLKVSRVSLGSWLTFGDALGAPDSERVIHTAFEAGVNLFDTADVYHEGQGEVALGRAIRELPRHRLVIASKCFFPMSEDVNDRGLSRKHIHESVRASLKRLQTDYLDLYQCHRPDPDTPLPETCRAMDDLIRRGDILYWGVSKWPADLLAEAVALCRGAGWAAPISNQPLYNLLDREIEQDVLPTGERLGLGQIVYSPLAQGVLTGKYRHGAAPPKGTRAADDKGSRFISRYMTPDRLAQVEGLVEAAERVGCTAAQLALAWCLRDQRVTSVIVGARTVEQLQDNLGCLDVPCDNSLCQELEDLFP